MFQAAREPAEAVRGDDPVARNHEPDRVPPEGLSHGPLRIGLADRFRNLAVGRDLAERDLPRRLVHPTLERGAVREVQGDIAEIRAPSAEELLDLLIDPIRAAPRRPRLRETQFPEAAVVRHNLEVPDRGVYDPSLRALTGVR